MLSAVGRLNSELLTMYYGNEPTSSKKISDSLREANMLFRRAHSNLIVATGQDRHDAEEAEMSDMAAMSRHVSRHTLQPNSMCAGPCVHIPRGSVRPIREAVDGLYGPDRPAAVKRLTAELARRGRSTDPRLCSTGIPCAAARFEKSNDVANLRDVATPNREKLAAQIFKEATYTRKLANMVSTSRVRELEAGDAHFSRMDLSGGGQERVSDRDSVHQFFREHQLGAAPDTGNIRVALDHVVDTIAPHARKNVKIDLWSRWMGI